MKIENSISFFIFTLVASIYLYYLTSNSLFITISLIGKIIAIFTFIISLLGLYFISIRIKKTQSYIYYILLIITSIILFITELFISKINLITKYYFVIAVLIALLLSLLDLKKYISYKYNIKIYIKKINEFKEEIQKLNVNLLKQSNIIHSYKQEIESKNNEIKELNEKQNEIISEYNKIEKQLKKSETEITKQTNLKVKYSKTLSNLKRKKKEEEELLVVSSDGKSVHRPKCIAVRNVPKENRKLIKNWNVAKKEGYEGCKLCKPHIKPEVIIRKGKKYKFVGANNSDKVHKASCILVKNISEKERIYFKTYKEALKKKYTSCRVCNPDQYQNT